MALSESLSGVGKGEDMKQDHGVPEGGNMEQDHHGVPEGGDMKQDYHALPEGGNMKQDHHGVPEGEVQLHGWARVRRILSLVSVEPVVFMTLLGFGLDIALSDKLWLDKVCRIHYNFNQTDCDVLSDGNHEQQEADVQRVASRYRVYAKVVQHVPGTAMMLLLAACSDALDRRLPLIVCHVGFAGMALCAAANAWWWWLPPQTLLLNYFFLGAGGGVLGFIVSVEAYVSAQSSIRSRTLRLALLKALGVAGKAAGGGVALLLFESGGFIAVFVTQSCVFLSVIIYVLLRLEKHPGETTPVAEPQMEQQQQQQHKESRALSIIKQTKTALVLVCGASSRRQLLARMCTVWLVIFSLGSLHFVFFSARARFQWNYKNYTAWHVTHISVSFLGPLLVVPLLTQVWHVRDGVVGLIGSLSLMFKNVLLAAAPKSWVLYLGIVVGLCGDNVGVAARSGVSKAVEKEHLGAVFAGLALGEVVMPIVAMATYHTLYTSTLYVFPGTVFFVSAFCCIVLSCIFVWDMRFARRGSSKENEADNPRSLEHQERDNEKDSAKDSAKDKDDDATELSVSISNPSGP